MPRVYPSFYRAMHNAWNAYLDDHIDLVPHCTADPDKYEPDEHGFCYDNAAMVRVVLHAEGLRFVTDGAPGRFDTGETVPVERPTQGD